MGVGKGWKGEERKDIKERKVGRERKERIGRESKERIVS